MSEERDLLPPSPIGICEIFDDYEEARERMGEVLRRDCDARLERRDNGWGIYWCVQGGESR